MKSQRETYLKRLEKKTLFVLGDEAAAYGALFAGCTFFGGYPITPASEIAETLSRELPYIDGHYVQMEDEIASISAVIGSAWAGARAMTATSGPGFSLMQENIGYACMTETPCVIIDVQRSGPSTGQATKPAQGDVMQARWGTHGDHEIIALAPSTVQECCDLMIDCFNLAETYRTPVIFLMDGEIGHLRERLTLPTLADVVLAPRRKAVGEELAFGGMTIPPMIEFGDGRFVHVTGSTHKANGMRDVESQDVHDELVRRLVDKIERDRDRIVRLEEHQMDDAEAAIVAYGATARPAQGAMLKLRREGKKVGLIRLITLWPFPQAQIKELDQKVRRIFVPEMNLGQVNREIERFVSRDVVPISKIGGIPHTVDEIADVVRRSM